ncbi:MAG: hypothetical protein IKR33_07995 [Bacteroidales bacterium]|nr:hypothetical protein [Bacteroidales bacterium]
MSHTTAVKIYEYASYALIIGATVIYFTLKTQGVQLTLLVLALAIFCRWMMDRHRYKACEQENDELRADLRRLTQLLAEEKKKNA